MLSRTVQSSLLQEKNIQVKRIYGIVHPGTPCAKLNKTFNFFPRCKRDIFPQCNIAIQQYYIDMSLPGERDTAPTPRYKIAPYESDAQLRHKLVNVIVITSHLNTTPEHNHNPKRNPNCIPDSKRNHNSKSIPVPKPNPNPISNYTPNSNV